MVKDQAEIGIFGGTGIYDSGLLQDSKEIIIETPLESLMGKKLHLCQDMEKSTLFHHI